MITPVNIALLGALLLAVVLMTVARRRRSASASDPVSTDAPADDPTVPALDPRVEPEIEPVAETPADDDPVVAESVPLSPTPSPAPVLAPHERPLCLGLGAPHGRAPGSQLARRTTLPVAAPAPPPAHAVAQHGPVTVLIDPAALLSAAGDGIERAASRTADGGVCWEMVLRVEMRPAPASVEEIPVVAAFEPVEDEPVFAPEPQEQHELALAEAAAALAPPAPDLGEEILSDLDDRFAADADADPDPDATPSGELGDIITEPGWYVPGEGDMSWDIPETDMATGEYSAPAPAEEDAFLPPAEETDAPLLGEGAVGFDATTGWAPEPEPADLGSTEAEAQVEPEMAFEPFAPEAEESLEPAEASFDLGAWDDDPIVDDGHTALPAIPAPSFEPAPPSFVTASVDPGPLMAAPASSGGQRVPFGDGTGWELNVRLELRPSADAPGSRPGD